MSYENRNKQTPRPNVAPPSQYSLAAVTGPTERLIERLGTGDASMVNQPSAALCWHIVVGDDGEQYLYSPEAYARYRAEQGICSVCGDRYPDGAAYCIVCGIPRSPATGKTERL